MNLRYFGIAALIGLAAIWLFDRQAIHARSRLLTASFYGDECKGKLMANGKPFDPKKFTVASWDYPLGTMLRISANGKVVACVVTDRGPHKRLLKTRQVDLSRASFLALSPLEVGLLKVTVEVL